MLTPAAVKAATPQANAYKLYDAGGLHLHVAPTGCKAWRWRYRRAGGETLLTLGRYPAVSLAEARAMRDAARARLAAGGDPSAINQTGQTFGALADAWHQHQADQWSTAHAADVYASLERDIFPAIGKRPAAEITAPDLLAALRLVEARGCVATASRLRQRLSMIFAYGVAEGLIEHDPAARLSAAMRKAKPSRPQPALTSVEECSALLAACDSLGAGSVQLASCFLALTAVRLDAVRGMRWGEVEGLDGAEPVWRVPAARMKLAKVKKAEARYDHIVPLSPAAVSVLREASRLSKSAWPYRPDQSQDLVFHGRSNGSLIGENAIGALYARAGFAGRHVPHGWRASFSTILNEDMGEDWRFAIDRALAHSPKDKVEAAYNRASMLGRRRAVFNRWGEMLAG